MKISEMKDDLQELFDAMDSHTDWFVRRVEAIQSGDPRLAGYIDKHFLPDLKMEIQKKAKIVNEKFNSKNEDEYEAGKK